MKKLFFVIVVSAIICSCSKNEEKTNKAEIVGRWGLKAVLSDPGDGSGTFQEIDSDKIIEFFDDGRIKSNGTLCDMSPLTGFPTEGTYSLSDSTISSSACQNLPMKLTFQISGSYMIINYPCIEPCRAKFVKL